MKKEILYIGLDVHIKSIDAANECPHRIKRITEQIQGLVGQWGRAPFVRAYQALRGVSLIVATIALDISKSGILLETPDSIKWT